MQAVRTLIAWAGDDPQRDGLLDTPKRVVDAFAEWFSGYHETAADHLQRSFDNPAGYQDMVLVRNMTVVSHCEHHLAPILGRASIAYRPRERIVGLSKLARVVDMFCRRLQTQETLTAQIGEALESALDPAGVAVRIDAVHQCMTTRGVRHPDTRTTTLHFSGVFDEDSRLQERFLREVSA
jgi:GTP cyclohydrolase I